jgi:hypothetical protein
MQWLLLVISLLFVLPATAVADPDEPQTAKLPAVAQPSPPLASKAARKQPSANVGGPVTMSPAEIRQTSTTQFKQCLNDWDAATHMTKKEWGRTCRRVVDARVKFLAEQRGR